MAGFEGALRALGPDLSAHSFAQLVAAAEQAGPNLGLETVIGLYRGWIAAHAGGSPQLYAAWFNLGCELNIAGDTDGARLAYQTALGLRPGFAAAAANLGLLHERAGDRQGALAIWGQALQPAAARISLINHMARLLEQQGSLAEAEAQLRASLLTSPLQPDVIQHFVHIRQKMCLWPVLATDVPGVPEATQIQHCGPLSALALFDQVATQTEIAAGWIARKTCAPGNRLSPEQGYPHMRLRIGYLSSDFCRHAMSYLIAELFERHDRSRFEIYGYCTTLEDGSDIRRRVLAGFDHYRPIRELTDEEAAWLIRQDEIDILVDLNGLTKGARLQILRWRPAPVQATYLGFVGPVPLPELDFLLCDDGVVPPDIAALYQPTPLYIGQTYQANDQRREIGPPTTRTAVGLPASGFVFACFSNHYKITEAMFANWMGILRGVPGSVLWLAEDNGWSKQNLQRHAAAAGVAPGRLIFAGRVSPADYMARLGVADLFLDTFPYNAGTIASDAIRMGLPMVTLQGQAFASRMAGRLLAAIGADAGVARDYPEYANIAIGLAINPGAYEDFKSLFTEERWASTLGNIGRLTAELENTFERIAKRPS